MKDRESHYILEEEKDEIPLDIQVEDSTNISVEDSSVSTRKISSNPFSIDEGDLLRVETELSSTEILVESST